MGNERLRKGSRGIFAAGQDSCEGVNDLFGSSFFGEITGSSRFQHARGILVLRVHGHNQHLGLRLHALNLLEHVQAALARHSDVEQDHVPSSFLDQAESLAGIAGLAEERLRKIPGEDLLKAVAYYRVIIY